MPKLPLSIGAVVILLSSLMMASAGTAHAATCNYIAQDSAGKYAHAYGRAKAKKMSTACDRARRECHRQLKRAFKKHTAGRGAQCYRLQEATG